MKRLLPSISRILLFIVLSSCGKKKEEKQMDVPADVPGDAVTLTSFPLAKGHSWTYTINKQQVYAGITYPVETSEYTTTIVNDTVVNGLHVYTGSTDYFLEDLFDGVKMSNSNLYVAYNNQCYKIDSLSQADTTLLKDSCEHILQYPATPQSKWWYNKGYMSRGFGWTSYVKVNTVAGSFNCVRLDVHTSNNNPQLSVELGGYTQYYSKKGLVQQITTTISSASSGGGNVTTTVMRLKSVNF